MIKTRYLLGVLAAMLLTGCIGNSPYYTTYYLDKGFVGHPVNEFFYVYGYPSGRLEKANGNVVYQWVSAQSITDASKANPNIYTSPNGSYQAVDAYSGSVQRQYCELRINTDKNEIVRSFDIVVDTDGKWSTSRCSEIFNRIYP